MLHYTYIHISSTYFLLCGKCCLFWCKRHVLACQERSVRQPLALIIYPGSLLILYVVKCHRCALHAFLGSFQVSYTYINVLLKVYMKKWCTYKIGVRNVICNKQFIVYFNSNTLGKFFTRICYTYTWNKLFVVCFEVHMYILVRIRKGYFTISHYIAIQRSFVLLCIIFLLIFLFCVNTLLRCCMFYEDQLHTGI